jgi:antitoxin (DNA-binding transcriptional repressor) of toxin-antitoxin stability system
MRPIQLQEAQNRLPELINAVAHGEEVVIERGDGMTFKIVLVAPVKPYPRFGSAKGLVEIADHFDEPLEDFKDYME